MLCMVVLVVLNKKGGVGKTTIATNLAQGLSILGKKVLAIDNDEQHNLTASLGLSPKDYDVSLADIYAASSKMAESVIENVVLESFLENLHVIPGGKGLERANPSRSALLNVLQSKYIQSMAYDVAIIDNSPSIDVKTQCAITCGDVFILPVQLRQFAIDGLVELFASLTQEYGVSSEKIRIVRNMYRNTTNCQMASVLLEGRYPDNLVETVIPDDEAFERLLCKDKSVFFSRTKCRGTLKFQELIGELFGINYDDMMELFSKKIKEYRGYIAGKNIKKAHILNLALKN